MPCQKFHLTEQGTLNINKSVFPFLSYTSYFIISLFEQASTPSILAIYPGLYLHLYSAQEPGSILMASSVFNISIFTQFSN